MAANPFGAHPGVRQSDAILKLFIKLVAAEGPADDLDVSAVVERDPADL